MVLTGLVLAGATVASTVAPGPGAFELMRGIVRDTYLGPSGSEQDGLFLSMSDSGFPVASDVVIFVVTVERRQPCAETGETLLKLTFVFLDDRLESWIAKGTLLGCTDPAGVAERRQHAVSGISSALGVSPVSEHGGRHGEVVVTFSSPERRSFPVLFDSCGWAVSAGPP